MNINTRTPRSNTGTYRHRHNHGTKHTYLDDCVRNGSLLNALASVLVPSARLEKPYLRPQSVDECEINLSVALQTLQSASLLDKDLDIQAIAFAMGTYRFRCRNQGSLSLSHTHTHSLSLT